MKNNLSEIEATDSALAIISIKKTSTTETYRQASMWIFPLASDQKVFMCGINSFKELPIPKKKIMLLCKPVFWRTA